MQFQSNPRILWVLLILFFAGGIFLGILAIRQFDHPLDHYWELLTHDSVVQIIMFDFLFFFIWVLLWMIDRGKDGNRMLLPWILLGAIAASLMIYIFILTESRDNKA